MKDETVKTTLRLPRDLWIETQHRAIDEQCAAQDVVRRALEQYLKRKGARR